ncbi:hypothetical protein COCMIDRAFT_30543 [Bipolaris oryzae ATCC 44560]|uniref:Uncharacterized protein n=1 Tax=Bipolaris oryzae ATCC 44560 TaxID=930090 RepID=W6YSD8_COCMI|nr:uncharacterized protein COCMIDRAFT_30543 [Bipolaris oryzae ATCC 44560]EUC40535.1 hypothetical protein COCMIDRAFT_30543 [Bipolaris oryzae ATCC 44560]
MNFTQSPPGAVDNSSVSLDDDTLKALCQVTELEKFQFRAFRQIYQDVGPGVRPSQYKGDVTINIKRLGLPTNKSVVEAVQKLRSGYEKTAEAFSAEAFPPDVNKEIALQQTVKLAYLIDPASYDVHPKVFRFENEPVFPVKWESSQTFEDFFNTAFPITTNAQELWTASTEKRSLKAWKLCQRQKIRIERTDDLAEHLVYDARKKTLMVFHQVEWLKAQIYNTKMRALDEPVKTSFSAGTLPPQLLVETFSTIYDILFPIATCKKTDEIAERLVEQEKCPFDPNLLIYTRLDRSIPKDFKYLYWSKRLRTLQNLMKAPPPKHKITSWFERHTSERNALTVAIIGLFLSVLFGFLGLLVGIAQLVISIMAWKYPV